jgi:hypothetical protein
MVRAGLGRITPGERGVVSCRHCERSAAIHSFPLRHGLLRFARNDGILRVRLFENLNLRTRERALPFPPVAEA